MLPVLKAQTAGQLYSENKNALKGQLKHFFEDARKDSINLIPQNKILRAIIVPHGGYSFSGLCAAQIYKQFNPAKYKRVAIFAPCHKNYFNGIATYPQEAYETPLGISPRSKIPYDLAVDLNQNVFFGEHGAELQLPFLQYRLLEEKISLAKYEINMFLYANINEKQLISVINKLFYDEADTFFIFSSDLSHSYDLKTAKFKDFQSINYILQKDAFQTAKSEVCGKIAISSFFSSEINHEKLESKLISYTTSADYLKNEKNVIGYSSIAFFEEEKVNNNKSLDEMLESNKIMQKDILKYARDNMKHYIREKKALAENDLLNKYPKLIEKKACSISLTVHGFPRGTTNNLLLKNSLIEEIKINSINAAFKDARFSPLREHEIDNITIQISIIKTAYFLFYFSKENLFTKLSPNEDGVLMSYRGRNALFLPYMWANFTTKTDFLDELSKSGNIPPNAWKDPDSGIKIFLFRLLNFKEE